MEDWFKIPEVVRYFEFIETKISMYGFMLAGLVFSSPESLRFVLGIASFVFLTFEVERSGKFPSAIQRMRENRSFDGSDAADAEYQQSQLALRHMVRLPVFWFAMAFLGIATVSAKL